MVTPLFGLGLRLNDLGLSDLGLSDLGLSDLGLSLGWATWEGFSLGPSLGVCGKPNPKKSPPPFQEKGGLS